MNDKILFKIKNECSKSEKCINCKFFNEKHITQGDYDVCILEIDPCKWNIKEIKRRLREAKQMINEQELYRIAFELLLKDDCLNDKEWLGTLDELYEGRKEYYLNKAIEKFNKGDIDE